MKPRSDQPGVAIIGMSCRFPGAPNWRAFWANLVAGVESIAGLSDEDLLRAGVPEQSIRDPTYVKAAALLDNIECFDAPFFEYSPGEARLMDPQQRLLLEVAWEAFEDAGYRPGGATGVFVGCGGIASSYLLDRLAVSNDLRGYTGSLSHLGNDKDFASTRISYKLNLRGPSINVQTACSTSLVAVHLACQSILSGECDMALAGASTVRVPQKIGYHSIKGGILSRDGHCCAFDAEATGTLFGSGVAAVLLKDAGRALEDGDHIYAVIRGTAINNDGADKVSYTASSVQGQANAMVEALTVAQVDATDIGYVECHGTGTIVGDPLELAALSRAFRVTTDKRQFCAIGSVKTNFGHLEQCAGMAGLIKTALALYHKKIPPSLHFHKPNPKFDFAASAFFVNTECRGWPGKAGRRFAAVNSLGLGGTNAFAVLAEAPAGKRKALPVQPHLFVFSAKTAEALTASLQRYADFLDENADLSPADISRTLAEGRQHFPVRFAVVADGLPALSGALRMAAPSSFQTQEEQAPRLIFLFSGQAAQYPGMGAELYRREPGFREIIDRCEEMFGAARRYGLKEVLFNPHRRSQLNQTCNTQPALYAVQCALTNLWRLRGIIPDAVIGHSVGEFAAAFYAGVCTLEDGLALVLKRSELMQSLQPGSMAAIAADPQRVLEAMGEVQCKELSVAALNAPANTVISGPDASVTQMLAILRKRGVAGQKLPVSRAFHSPLMRPVMSAFKEASSRIPLYKPKVDWISTVSGRLMSEALSADYWVEHALKPVRFSEALAAAGGPAQYVEIGPGDTLLSLGRQCSAAMPSSWHASMRKGREYGSFLDSLRDLYHCGHDIDWTAFGAGDGGRRISLPGYPFERHRYWIEGDGRRADSAPSAAQGLGGRQLSSASDDEIFESVYSLREIPYLNDHRIHGHPVLPFMAGLAAIVEAARKLETQTSVQLANLQYHSAMILPEADDIRVQIVFAPAENGARHVRLAGFAAEKWQPHIQGQVRPIAGENQNVAMTTSIDAIKARCATEIGKDIYYAFLRGLGLQYGPSFRAIEELYRGNGEVLTRVSLPQHLALPDTGQHPALLDASLHVYPLLAEEYSDLNIAENTQASYLPVGLERLVLAGTPCREVWVHARRREQNAPQQTLTVDITILDDHGHTIAFLDGLLLKILPATILTQGRLPDAGKWLYQLKWTPSEIELLPEATGVPRSSWLVLADKGDLARELAARLTRRGDACMLLEADYLDRRIRSLSAMEDMRALVQHAIETAAGTDAPPLRGVIDLRPADVHQPIKSAADIDRLQHGMVGGAAAIFQALAHVEMPQPATARVWLVTKNAVSVDGKDAPVNPFAASIWGLGRSAALEHPNAWGGLVDLDAEASARMAAEALFDQILHGGHEDQVAMRGRKRFSARLVRMPTPRTAVRFDSEACYLITGGFGAVGSELAKWLVTRHEVRHLVLVSRQGEADPRAPALCEELRKLGADVTECRADITRERDVKTVLASVDRSRRVLKGVFHCAGMLDDGILAQADWAKFQRVMQPKIAGAWLLDKLTRKYPLDHFVLFSSVLSLIGSAGQANYAAANTYLDALAARRRQDGLAALALNWGPWAAEGLATASGEKGRALWRARGTQFITTDEAWAAFHALIGKCQGHAAITITDWSVLARQFETMPQLYAHLRSEYLSAPAAQPQYDTAGLRARLKKTTGSERRAVLADFVTAAVAGTLGITQAIDPARSLQQYGLDSLMSVTLINRLESALGIRISMAKLIRGPNLSELVDGLIAEMGADQPVAEAQISAPSASEKGHWLTLVAPRSNPRVRLFCFPFAGGGSAVYRNWVPSIDDDIEIVAIEPPGRLNRIDEEPVSDIDEFVRQAMAELQDKLDRPFVFFGHCLGGLTMYETTRQLLHTTSYRPQHLFVSGARPPDKLVDQGDFEQQLLRDLMQFADYRMNLPSHAQPDDVFAAIIRRFGILATEQLLDEPELRDLMLPVIRAEFRMANNYVFRPEPPWDIPITCFHAREDPYVTREHALGWGRFTDKRLQTHMRSGAHFAVAEDLAFITSVINRECRF